MSALILLFNPSPKKDQIKTKIDPQIFVPLQAGRISSEEVQRIINEGREHVDEFIEYTQKHPLYLAYSKGALF